MIFQKFWFFVFSFSCLINRGADINIADDSRCLPDDLLQSDSTTDDSQLIIKLHRKQRIENLSDKVITVSIEMFPFVVWR